MIPIGRPKSAKGEAMRYHAAYEWLIRRALARMTQHRYTEDHHIIPRSLGGSDDPENMVTLTYREHFLAHWLLTKMFDGIEKRKMTFALLSMSMSIPSSGRIISSWQFDLVKRLCRQQRLATYKQRKKFEAEQQLANEQRLFSEAIDRRRKAEAFVADVVDAKNGMELARAASDFLALETYRRRDGSYNIQRKINMQRSHKRRLEKWKQRRNPSLRLRGRSL